MRVSMWLKRSPDGSSRCLAWVSSTVGPSGRTWHTTTREPIMLSAHVEQPTEDGAQKGLIAVPRLLRFRLRSDGAGRTPVVIDSESIIEWDIGDALAAEGYHRDPRKNKVNIEGLAVRTLRDKAGQLTL